MSKRFYTERDIEDMVARGEMSLEVCEEVVLTELAYEKAERLGLRLVQPHQLPPAAPVRPYLSAPAQLCPQCQPQPVLDQPELRQRIRDAVNARLGSQVDPALLDAIINRVLDNIGIK